MQRLYLDHNATTPLHCEAREAMISAMDKVGNPSSIHAEGRAAKAIVEKSREDLAVALGADGADVIFTSGATEAASLALSNYGIHCASIEHDAVLVCCESSIATDCNGLVKVPSPQNTALQIANSETGIIQDLPQGLYFSDMTQGFGKTPIAFNWTGVHMAAVSAHKIGGPKGVGALVVKSGTHVQAKIKGGGQEKGRRSGTENVIGIAGFAAAAKVAQKELSNGSWDEVEELRNYFEIAIAQMIPDTIFVGRGVQRLQNTSCIVAPGWAGETQVMQMDLSGIAVSAGAACSSGKVQGSRVLSAMGISSEASKCSIRISLSTRTTKNEIDRFIDCWTTKKRKKSFRRVN